MIKMLVLDIDGVLTDGKLVIDALGNEYKSINIRDLDGMTWLKNRGVDLALLTGEDNVLADVVAKRLGVAHLIKGAKDKEGALRRLSERARVPLNSICYIGDADRDADALKACGLSMVPINATPRAKESASVVLQSRGGDGVIQEVMEYMIENGFLE